MTEVPDITTLPPTPRRSLRSRLNPNVVKGFAAGTLATAAAFFAHGKLKDHVDVEKEDGVLTVTFDENPETTE